MSQFRNHCHRTVRLPVLSRKLLAGVALLVIAAAAFALPSFAQEEPEDLYTIRLNQAAVDRGYTINHANGALTVAVPQQALDRPATVTLKPLPFAADDPAGFRRVSDVYSYDVYTDPQITKTQKPLTLVQRYRSDQPRVKAMFFWDGIAKTWRRLPTVINDQAQWARTAFPLPHARIAVFEDDRQIEGVASWYRSSAQPHGAASNDFPLGTGLRVTNRDTGKSVNVTVASAGPFAAGRVIDLSLVAFEEIASQREGLAHVTVVPLDALAASASASTAAKSPAPPTRGQTVFVWRADNDQTLYEKNYRLRPIASLTKLITALVFLDTNPDWSREVAYDSADNAEGSKLAVSPGETMTVHDVFQVMLVGSANNATKMVVRVSGLTREEFVRQMNDKAKALSMNYTRFTEPTGLDPANVSTPGDVTKLVHAALAKPDIQKATMLPAYTFATRNTGISHTIKSTNKLLDDGLPMVGGKTGFLNESGYCLAVEITGANGIKVVAMTLGAPSQATRDSDVLAVSRWALRQL